MSAIEIDFWTKANRTFMIKMIRNEEFGNTWKYNVIYRATRSRLSFYEDYLSTTMQKDVGNRLYVHVRRMGEERLPKKMLRWNPSRKKSSKPKKSWLCGKVGHEGENHSREPA